jgi:hypothetical protein
MKLFSVQPLIMTMVPRANAFFLHRKKKDVQVGRHHAASDMDLDKYYAAMRPKFVRMASA